jgi:broad specificity phosphatase PhoE
MSTRIYLVRHGSTMLSAEDAFAGSTDVALSPEGRRQAQLLGERLVPDQICAAYCSPMSRTVDTARLIASQFGLEPETRDGLRELSHGHWEGMRRADVEAQFPAEYASWEADPFTFAPEGGESGLSVMARALPVIREVVVKHDGMNVLVVSHKATIRLIISSLLGFDARGYRDRLDQQPASLNVIEFKDPVRARLMLFNDISHYANRIQRPSGQLSKWWDVPEQPG